MCLLDVRLRTKFPKVLLFMLVLGSLKSKCLVRETNAHEPSAAQQFPFETEGCVSQQHQAASHNLFFAEFPAYYLLFF